MNAARAAIILAGLAGISTQAAGAIARSPTSTAGFVGTARQGPVDTPVLVQSLSEFLAAFGAFDASLTNPWLEPSVQAFFTNGGTRCYAVRVAASTDAAYLAGLEALRGIGEVSILSVPGVYSPAVQAGAIAQCEALGSRFAVLDPPRGVDPAGVLTQRQGLQSVEGFAALYYPWISAPAGGADRLLPPSGFVAGVYARIDATQGVWKAPIGAVLGATGLERALTDGDQEMLNPAGVSVIRSFPGSGIQVWGARTIASDPDWIYVSVRRFAIFLEASIAEGTGYAVFEPNDETLWARLRTDVEDFLLSLWRDGALQGTTSNQAFLVRCDRTTMTQNDIDNGRTLLLVGIAALRPAEFILLRIVIQRPQAAPTYRRGDANGDGRFDISDPLALLSFLFQGTASPPCRSAADMNGSGALDVSDAIYALTFLFLGGAAPPEPFVTCGALAAGSTLDCGSPPKCP
jgi:uncharacterized protein